jgi:hypothetical protein
VDNAPGVYWSVLECDIFIISACLPSVRSLLGKMFPSWFGNTKNDSRYMSGSRKYYRQNDSNGNITPSSHHLSHLSKSGKIMKSVDLHITHESRETADDKELLGHSAGHVYGA